MHFEGRFADALIKGDVGPERVGGVSVCLQGGTIRGCAGSLCHVSVPDAAQRSTGAALPRTPHELPGNYLQNPQAPVEYSSFI